MDMTVPQRVTIADLADRIGVPLSTVYRWVGEMEAGTRTGPTVRRDPFRPRRRYFHAEDVDAWLSQVLIAA
jgi:transposase-like protein